MFTIKQLPRLIFTFSLLAVFMLVGCDSQPSGQTGGANNAVSNKIDDEVAVLETDMGKIVIEFFPGDAPLHVANFKKLAKEGFFDGTAFHRVIPNTIIQGGDPNTKSGEPGTWGMGQPNQPTVKAEFNARKHLRGIVSAARRGDDVNSATSQFFICLKAKPDWDNQYSIFGRVVEGLNVAEIISTAPTDFGSERPVEKMTIKKVTLEKRGNYGETPSYREQPQ
jgi:cyclophilin family peptidyl-prolyl cis-trans isomerase